MADHIQLLGDHNDSDSESRHISSEPEDYISDEDEFIRKSSLFAPYDMVIKINRKKLYIRKELLMKESPVFDRMFSADFMEKDAKEIDLPGKNVVTFVNFLRCTLPGIDENFTDDTVHNVLPLAWEYQVERVLKKADDYLAEQCLEEENDIPSWRIIENILEAELYKLSSYLDTCIQIASRKWYKILVKDRKFQEISMDTRLQISLRRWEDMDAMFAETDFFTVRQPVSRYQTKRVHVQPRLSFDQVGEKMKTFMNKQ